MNLKNPFVFLTVASIASLAVSDSTQTAWAVIFQSEQQEPNGFNGFSGFAGLPPIVSANTANANNAVPSNPAVPMDKGVGSDKSWPPIVKSNSVNQGLNGWASSNTSNSATAKSMAAGMLNPILQDASAGSKPSTAPPLIKSSNTAVQGALSPISGPAVLNGQMPADEPVEAPFFPRTKVTGEPLSLPSHSSAGVPFFSSPPATNNSSGSIQSVSNPSTRNRNLQDSAILDPPELPGNNSGNLDLSASQLPAETSQDGMSYGMPNGMPYGMPYDTSGYDQDYGMSSRYGTGVGASPYVGEDYFGGGGFDSMEGYFGAMGAARFYAEIDVMYMNRNRGSMVLSNFGSTGNFDWNFGWQGTFGTRLDALSGREISYMGTADISNSITRVDPAGRLSALFASSPLFGALADPFFDAELQQERIRTRMHSVEFNRVKWGWDVMKMFFGFRYINMADEYSMFSQSGADVGTFRLRTNNDLFGVHIGEELFYDVGYRLSMSGGLKLGIYGNSNRIRTNAISNGTEFINSQSRNGTFSTTIDANLTFHYQINRRARLRAGYEALVLDRVVTAADNSPGFLSPFTGTGNGNRDTVVYHGFAAGLEFYR